PFGAETMCKAAIGRLRFDKSDPEARVWLKRGLGLEPRAIDWVAKATLAIRAEDALADAIPGTIDARRAFATILLTRGRFGRAGAAIDALARLEEDTELGTDETNRPVGQFEAARRTHRQTYRPVGSVIEPGAWLDAAGGQPIAAPDAPAL